MRKAIIIVVLLGVFVCHSFAKVVIFDAVKFAQQNLLNKIEDQGWSKYLEKFQTAFDKFMQFRAGYLWPLEQMKPESFDMLTNLSDLKDLEKYFSGPFLRNSNNGEIWFDLFNRQATLVSRYQGLSLMGNQEQLTVMAGALEKDENLKIFVEDNLKMEADHIAGLEQLLQFLSDMREWDTKRVDKMQDYVQVALEVTEAAKWKERLANTPEGESAGLMIHASTPKLKAVSASLDLENLYLKIQQVALARVELESLLKERVMEVDMKKRKKKMEDAAMRMETQQ